MGKWTITTMDKIEKILKAHYRNRKLDPGRVEMILKGCAPARQVYRWRRLAVAGFGIAAAAVLALLGVLSGAIPIFSGNEPAAEIAGKEEENDTKRPTLETSSFQLIAVKIHADPCRRCHKLEPIFAELKKQFSEKPVLFLTFDHSTKESRRQAQLLSEQLGLGDIYRKYRSTGVIVLIDRAGQVREIVDSNVTMANAAKVVDRNLISG